MDHITELRHLELQKLKELTPLSEKNMRRALNRMPLATPSSIFSIPPYPIAIESGDGPFISDLDGNRFIDYGGGYGTTVFGHNHPKITEAIMKRAADGVFFGAVSNDATAWAELMAERFLLDWVRFSPSGTEAVMDTLRLAMALTGRDKIVKAEGAYHGTSPWALISTHPKDGRGSHENPLPVPVGKGLDTVKNIQPVPFNDLTVAEKHLRARDVAAIIIEPVMFNVGAIFPVEGYLQGLREICDRTGTLLVFDEVKTGISIAFGGAEEFFGVKPDLKCFGKGIGGGVSCGAFGGADDRGYEAIRLWTAPHFGTFSGNPLAAAAGRAALEVMDDFAYAALEEHRMLLAEGLTQAIDDAGLPGYVLGAGAKNCVVWADPAEGHLKDFREYQIRVDANMGIAMWAWMMNRGIWLTPGRDEQTTHSLQHTEKEAERYVEVFDSYCQAAANK